MTDLILLTFAAGVLGIGAGGVLGIFVGGKSVKSEAILLSFSAGTMISLVCFELLTEAGETGGLFAAAAAALSGALCVTWLDYIVDKKTKHRNDFVTCENCEHKKAGSLQLFVAGVVMALAIAIHNIPEGMSVGAVYAEEGGQVGPALAVLIISIVLHNIPEGMAVAVPLITSGMKKGKAALVAALSGVPTVIGAMAGYVLGDMGDLGLTLSLGFAAGSLMYVVFGEVLPQSIKLYCSRKTAFAAIVGVIVGMLILGGHVHAH